MGAPSGFRGRDEGEGRGGGGGFRRDDGEGRGGGYRRDNGEGRSESVRDRLRARARKKARRQQRKKGFIRRKVCRFCADQHLKIDYKDAKTLRLFVTETGRMIPRRISGNCAKHQREMAVAIKRARHLSLLPFLSDE